MSKVEEAELTGRQKRELEYHREHAKSYQHLLDKPVSWDVLERPSRQWWNAYWQMYAYLVNCDLKGKRILIVGCGFGDDALRLAKLGAQVSAFDLSPDSLSLARTLANREGLSVSFEEMPAERLRYDDNLFDLVIARDILHHVDIPQTMSEIVRVSKPDALLVVNEIYSHSFTDRIRYSAVVRKILYPRMQRIIYGEGKPYITQDERKLSEVDMREIMKQLHACDLDKHFNFLVTRIVPDRLEFLAKMDRLLLIVLKPFARFLAGRVLFSARISK